MKNFRKYGKPPYYTAVIHGGPGAAGEMAPVAHELGKFFGVLEPLQTADSIIGQVQELKAILSTHASLPVTLIGFSWGAWLSVIFTARYPGMVRKLIVVGSGPFEDKYAAGIRKTRLSRLDQKEKRDFALLMESLEQGTDKSRKYILARLKKLFQKTEMYNPIQAKAHDVEFREDIYRKVWTEAAQLRKNGRLLALVGKIKVPVVAIHGNYDPHPARGVKQPLSRLIKNFHFILLKQCGHVPWYEREAKSGFFEILKRQLA